MSMQSGLYIRHLPDLVRSGAVPMGTLDVAKAQPSVVARLRREVETWSEERKDAVQRFVQSRAGTN